MTKVEMLRRALDGPRPVVVAGAHDGMSAKLVQEAGFDAVWASGFEICAAHGVPDASLLTMSEHLEAARVINAATDLPVIVDGDTGYGNAINARRAVRAFEDAGAAGLCIEDAVFPKHCSFYADVTRELAPVDEQALKILACLEARRTPDFVVIARTEAFVAGWGQDEALRRARAYADIGADAVLVHSKASVADEILTFARAWDRPVPLVCVPTTYHHATVDELGAAGYRIVIFANQGLRASISAMRRALRDLRQAGSAAAIADQIVPLGDVHRLVGVDELRAAERAYLPGRKETA